MALVSYTVSWDAQPDASFHVIDGLAAPGQGTIATVPAGTFTTTVALESNLAHKIAVKAFTVAGESGVNGYVDIPAQVPPAPTGVKVVKV